MKCSLANPNIAPHIKETLLAYQENQFLDTFYTTFYEHSEYPLTKGIMRLLPFLTREVKRRSINEIAYRNIKGRPLKELFRVLAARKLNPVLTDKIWEWSELDFDSWVSRKLHKGMDSIHTYEHAALATLQRAKQLGITSFYEQPSQYHTFFSSIVKDQIQKYPEFRTEAVGLLLDAKSERRNARRDKELQIADHIICNSSFTLRTLEAAGIDKKKVITIPLAFPDVVRVNPISNVSEKVIFMNAGGHNLRKGIHLLYEAWKQCNFGNKAELWMIGRNHLPEPFLRDLPDNIKFIPNIPRTELLALYEQANVFILPTMADGFGMVITEAMSRGVPVITTYSSGGPDIIEHGQNGLLIPPGDIEAIVTQLNWCVENRHLLPQMASKAIEKAASYPWKVYRKNLMEKITEKVRSNK